MDDGRHASNKCNVAKKTKLQIHCQSGDSNDTVMKHHPRSLKTEKLKTILEVSISGEMSVCLLVQFDPD